MGSVFNAPAPVAECIASALVVSYVAPAPAVHSAPAPVVGCIEPAPAVSYAAPAPAVIAAPAPVVEYIATTPIVSCVTPAPAICNAPAPGVEYIAPAPAVSYVATALYAAPAPVAQYIAPAPVVSYVAPAPDVCNTPRQRQPISTWGRKGRRQTHLLHVLTRSALHSSTKCPIWDVYIKLEHPSKWCPSHSNARANFVEVEIPKRTSQFAERKTLGENVGINEKSFLQRPRQGSRVDEDGPTERGRRQPGAEEHNRETR